MLGLWPDCNKLANMRLGGYVAAGSLAVTGTSVCLGQSAGFTPRKDAADVPSLEIISIHKTKDPKPYPDIHDEDDGFTAASASLRSLIAEAYGFSLVALSDQQLLGAPGWAKTEFFDVQAKVDSENVEKLKALKKAETMTVFGQGMASRTPTVEMVMLQRLLEGRFRVKVHYEQRVMSLFEMTVAKGGVRLKVAHPENPEHGSIGMSDGKLTGDNVPLSFSRCFCLWSRISDGRCWTGRGVQRITTLSCTGREWGTRRTTEPGGGAFVVYGYPGADGIEVSPSKGPVWVIVVDHAEMPSEN